MKASQIILTLAVAMLAAASSRIHADTFGSGDNTFDIEFVTIGNPGNPADTTGDPNPAGSVDYVYNIGKYEISREMVEKANAEGGLGLTLDPWPSFTDDGPRPGMPATGITWNEAARFTNWLNTSQGFSLAYKFSAQPGDEDYDAQANIELWEPVETGYDADNLFRNSEARYFLPSVHEWYKAAYYDPAANDGAGGYWDYPTGSDTYPTPVASGTDPDTAVTEADSPADTTQAGGLSPYGVMGQAGNAWEWEETEVDLVNDSVTSRRGLRGDSYMWQDLFPFMRADFRSGSSVDDAYGKGFRVASIPEPSSLWLAALGMTGLMLRRRRNV